MTPRPGNEIHSAPPRQAPRTPSAETSPRTARLCPHGAVRAGTVPLRAARTRPPLTPPRPSPRPCVSRPLNLSPASLIGAHPQQGLCLKKEKEENETERKEGGRQGGCPPGGGSGSGRLGRHLAPSFPACHPCGQLASSSPVFRLQDRVTVATSCPCPWDFVTTRTPVAAARDASVPGAVGSRPLPFTRQ